MRDKLIELIGDAPYGLRTLGQAADELISVERIADHLIASGVTLADVPDTNVGNKLMTNGDRIRAMTDEELAGFFGVQSVCGYIQDNYYELCETRGVCNGCVLNWLKQPVEVEA